jgi:hypothetical protein
MEQEKTAYVDPVIILLVIACVLYAIYQLTLQQVLFPDANTLGTMTFLVIVFGIVFAVDAIRFDGGQIVVRWSVSSIITAYFYVTPAAVVLTALFSNRTLGGAASMTLLCLGLALVRLAASWPISLAAVVGCCAALTIINTGFTYASVFAARAALYFCGSILLAELVLLLRLAFRIKERRRGFAG